MNPLAEPSQDDLYIPSSSMMVDSLMESSHEDAFGPGESPRSRLPAKKYLIKKDKQV